ncbi:MAG: hypothetical protein ACLTT1_19855 [[Clostridium] scindens]
MRCPLQKTAGTESVRFEQLNKKIEEIEEEIKAYADSTGGSENCR